jgi:hypothetical protein
MTTAAISQNYQYRNLDFAYHFKVKDGNITLKVQDTAEKILHKTPPFTFKTLQLPKDSLTDETVLKILPILVQKGLLPAQYFPATPQAESDTPASTPSPSLPSSPSLSSPPSSPEAIDQATLTQLQTFSQKSEALYKAIQLSEAEAIHAVAQNPHSIAHLIASQKQEEQILGELLLLQQHKPDIYQSYYLPLYQKATGICLATYTIKSGMVENANSSMAGKLSKGASSAGKFLDVAGKTLDQVGNVVPIVGPGLKILGALLQLKNIRDNHKAIAHLTRYFADLDTSLKHLKAVALLLVREREAELLVLKPQGKVKKAINAVKEWFTAEELTNPLVIEAGEDCEKLLIAILTQQLKAGATPEEAVSTILKRPLSKPQPVVVAAAVQAAAKSMITIPSTSPSDAASKSEVERIQRELETLKAKSAAEEAGKRDLQRQIQLLHAYMEAAFGPLVDDGLQLRLQALTDAAATKGLSPIQALLYALTTIMHETKTHTAQQDLAIAVMQEKLESVVQKQEAQEAKGIKKK